MLYQQLDHSTISVLIEHIKKKNALSHTSMAPLQTVEKVFVLIINLQLLL